MQGLLTGLAGAGKWVVGALVGGYAAERMFGGVQKTASDVGERGAEIQSGVQAQNLNIDNFFGGRAKLQGLVGLLSGLFALIAKFTGSETFAKWSNKLTDFRSDEQATTQVEINKMADTSVNNPKNVPYLNNPSVKTPNAGTDPNADGAGFWSTASTVAGVGGGLYGVRAISKRMAAAAEAAELAKAEKMAKITQGAAPAANGLGTAGSRVAGLTDDAAHIMQLAQTGGVTGGNAAGAAANTVVKTGGWLSKIPVIGKYLGGAALVGGVGLTLLSPSDAHSAQGPTATPSAVTPGATVPSTAPGSISTMREAGAMTAAVGASIVGSNMAAAATVPLAAPILASLGLKAIPGVASFVAAGEGIYNTANHALKGEFTKAGLSFVAGVGGTVAGLGGALTYTTLGTAWHEAVRYGGSKLFGKENTIEHSMVVQTVGMVDDALGLSDKLGLTGIFSGAASPASAPAPARTPAPRIGALAPVMP